MNLRFSRLHLLVAITRRSNCRSLGPAKEQRAVGNRRSLNGKVLSLLAIFWAMKVCFPTIPWLSHTTTPASLPRPPLCVLQRIILQIFCLKSPALAVGPFCAVHLQLQPQPAVFMVLSVCLSLCTLLITLPSPQQWHNGIWSYPLLRLTLSARYTRLFTIHSSQPDTPDCSQYTVASQMHQAVHNTQYPARYARLTTIQRNQPDTSDCSQYAVASPIHQTVHNTQYPAWYTRLFTITILSSQPSNYMSTVYVIYLLVNFCCMLQPHDHP